MSSRAGLRASIRSELNDSNASAYLWSDAVLNEWISEAIRDYSRVLPEEASATLSAVAGQSSYALPARCQLVLRVEQPPGLVRRLAEYRVFAGSLILDPPPDAAGPSQDIVLEYLRTYAEPAADGDVLATPSTDDDVLILLVAAKAVQWVAADEAKRLRYQERQGLGPGAAARAYQLRAQSALATRTGRLRARSLEVT